MREPPSRKGAKLCAKEGEVWRDRSDYCHTQPGCVRQADCVGSWLQAVTVPMQTEPVVDQLHPSCVLHVLCVVSCGHGVIVPPHGVVPTDQLHPN
jgi:hypothetical protein